MQIIEANLSDPVQEQAVVALTAAYAMDSMGNGAPLPPEVLHRLVPALREQATSIIFLAYVDENAVGIATCFRGFSTFAARPLLNIHDLAVLPEYRGRGIGQALLEVVIRKARVLGCVKVTLEVWENNVRARRVYENSGFAQAANGEETGGALFYTRAL